MQRALAALLSTAATIALAVSPASAQPPTPGSPYVIDGPSSAISRPSGLGVSIARDGTGGLVYLKAVGGTTHVFVSTLAGGLFQPPVEVDSQLSGASSQPVIAALDGGSLLVGFINAGSLYVVDGTGGQFAPPLGLAGDALNPAISATAFGKAYMAFAVADGSGHDVRSAYYHSGAWSLESQPLNATAADDAGTGGSRPVAVAAAGDGIAIVVWSEQGHINSRRVWGTSPSVVYEQADAPLPGCTESSVDDPVVGAGGDSSYAPVAFAATLICGGQNEYRVLVNRLHGSVYDGVTAADGLSEPSANRAGDLQISVGEYGGGWVTSNTSLTDDVFAASLGANSAFAGTVTQVNSLTGSEPLYAVPATAGLNANLIAWQQEPGAVPGGDIRVRFAGNGIALGPESVISSPAQGPTDAVDGLAAAGDVSGDAAIAWLQGPPDATELMVSQLYQPPGGFSPSNSFGYVTTPQPVLAWPRPGGWGPMRYSVTVDGSQLGQTGSNFFQVPAPLADGPHNWHVTATNPAGQQSGTPVNTVFVDTVAPIAHLRQLTHAVARSTFRMVARYVDHPPEGQPGYDASGVGAVLIRWGDGTVLHLRLGMHFVSHRYRGSGRYKVTLIVVDRAGNITSVVRFVKVFAAHRRRSGGASVHG